MGRGRRRSEEQIVEHRLLTVDQAAEYLQVSSRWVRRILREGHLKGVKIGKLWRVEPEALEEYVKARRKSQ